MERIYGKQFPYNFQLKNNSRWGAGYSFGQTDKMKLSLEYYLL
jgi:hypothetical protein